MRLGVVLLVLRVSSAWMVDRSDPRRAGQAHAAGTRWCPAPNCESELFASGERYVCENRHVSRWDEGQQKIVLQPEA